MVETTEVAAQDIDEPPPESPSGVAGGERRRVVAGVVVGVLVVALVITQRVGLRAAANAVVGGSPMWFAVGIVLCALTILNLAGLQRCSQSLVSTPGTSSPWSGCIACSTCGSRWSSAW